MIRRRQGMLPGMLASLLLATPIFAPRAHAEHARPAVADPNALRLAGGDARKAHASEQRRHGAGRHKSILARRRSHPAASPVVAFFDDSSVWHQHGIASWYGGARWQGQRTASGQRYEQNELTAAHSTLPLGTHVRVALDGSDRAVTVTITDRPGTRTRVIDLSRAAAQMLGMLDRGVAQVTLSLP